MFNWIKSPTLPDTIETQAFRSISGGPIFRINTLNDRTHRMKLVPWEDILEIFPNAIYLRDANGIVMPARDHLSKRISPKSIKLQADVVLEVVSSHDLPPTSARPENITTTNDDHIQQSPPSTGITGGRTSASSVSRGSTDFEPRSISSATSSIRASSESAHAHTHTPKYSSESARKQSQEATPRALSSVAAATTTATNNDDDEDDWSPFQANSAATFSAPQTLAIPEPTSTTTHTTRPHTHAQAPLSTTTNVGRDEGLDQHGIMASNDILRQEMIHRLELLSAEQEERLNLILTACRNRPHR
ncbi:hypothetical protein BG015_000081 [Linnemannia schmuckeri]|uniref:Uncharacterized protein n=1 Tax=Linnemannia schmuckeri TaxID=64567 RepID=A0A9P5V7D1_9FUNG|nr:hypothetical protein BG015_000081 [Linnemannia schmuckeri]